MPVRNRTACSDPLLTKSHRVLAFNFAFELALCSHPRDQRRDFNRADAAGLDCADHFWRLSNDVFFDPVRVDRRCVDRCKPAQPPLAKHEATRLIVNPSVLCCFLRFLSTEAPSLRVTLRKLHYFRGHFDGYVPG
jgi:hypothetical protein